MTNPVILIADDHSMVRRGLKLSIQFDLGYADIETVATCHDLMYELIRKKYTHLILDIILPDANTLEIIPNIRRVYPNLNILVFSMQNEEVYTNTLRKYGVKYFVSKSAKESAVISKLQRFFYNEIEKSTTVLSSRNPFTALSPRESEILHYLLNGSGTKEISIMLSLKINTISTLKHRIFEKTKSSNLRELLDLASLYNINY